MSRKLIVLVLVSVLLAPVALATNPAPGMPQMSWAADWLGWLWSLSSTVTQPASESVAQAGEEAAPTSGPYGLEEGEPTDTTTDAGPGIDPAGVAAGTSPWE